MFLQYFCKLVVLNVLYTKTSFDLIKKYDGLLNYPKAHKVDNVTSTSNSYNTEMLQ